MTSSVRSSSGAQPAVLLATASAEVAARLKAGLAPVAAVHVVALDGAAVLQRVENLRIGVVLVDFTEANHTQAAAVCEMLRLQAATAIAAVGRATHASDAIAALRANVQEFIDVDGPAEDLQTLLLRLLEQRRPSADARGTAIALLGARGGLGVSTLAANLSAVLQRQAGRRRTLLMDMGLPVADSHAILGVESGFTFADAARGLERLDRTLVDSAIPRSTHGIAVLPLPQHLQELREISHATATSVIARLRQFFEVLVIDLGGFTHTDFLLRVAASCDHCLLVCDQATTSVFSTARLATELAEKDVSARLVVNRADSSIAPAPAQVAEHVKLALAGVLPDRYTAHVRALNEGRLLAEAAPADPYVRAVQSLAQSLMAGAAPVPAPAAGGWLARLRRGAGTPVA
jgi:pilus assembly protein CpaE